MSVLSAMLRVPYKTMARGARGQENAAADAKKENPKGRCDLP
jgi:hypothetical protein